MWNNVERNCVCVCVCVGGGTFGGYKGAYNTVDEKTEGKRSLKRTGIRWIDRIKIVH